MSEAPADQSVNHGRCSCWSGGRCCRCSCASAHPPAGSAVRASAVATAAHLVLRQKTRRRAVTGDGALTFLVEQARQTADLELAIEQKIPARDDVVALAQSAEHGIGVIGARADHDLHRSKLALALLDIHELAHAAVEHGGHGHGEGKLVAFRLRARGRAGNLHERHLAGRALAALRLEYERVHRTGPQTFDSGGRRLAVRQQLGAESPR